MNSVFERKACKNVSDIFHLGSNIQGEMKADKSNNSKKNASTTSIKCPICEQTFYKPRLLPCSHTFCTPCLERNQIVENAVTCFTCKMEFKDLRNGVITLLPDYPMMNLIFNIEGKIFCSSCITEGVFSISKCNTCNNYLCSFCSEAHNKLMIFSKHNVIPIVDQYSEEENDNNNEYKVLDQTVLDITKCSNHKTQKVTHFCYKCQVVICSLCKKKEHNTSSHILDPVSVVSKNLGKLMTQNIEIGKSMTNDYASFLGSNIQKVDDNYKRTGLFINFLNLYKEEQLYSLDSHYAKFLMELYISKKINRTSKKIKVIKELNSSLKNYVNEAKVLSDMITSEKLRRALKKKLKFVMYNLKFIPKATDMISNLMNNLSYFIGSSNSKYNSVKSSPKFCKFTSNNTIQSGCLKLSANLISTYKTLKAVDKVIPNSRKSENNFKVISYHRKRVFQVIEKLVKRTKSDPTPSKKCLEKPLNVKIMLNECSSSSSSSNYSHAESSVPTDSSFSEMNSDRNFDNEKDTAFIPLMLEDWKYTSEDSDSDDKPYLVLSPSKLKNCNSMEEILNCLESLRLEQSDATCQTENPNEISIFNETSLISNEGNNECLGNMTTNNLKPDVSRLTMYYHNKFGLFSGTMVGQFHEPNGVAVNEAGDIIVADTNNNRVQVFNISGKFKFKFGQDGRLLYPNRVAVMLTTGEIIVSERAPTPQIQVFDKNGKFLRMFGSDILKFPRGLAVDNSGNVIVAESKIIRVTIFNLEGKLTSMFFSNILRFPISVDVNNQGEIFICDNLAHCVFVFNYSGLYLRRIGEEGITNYPFAVAVSPSGEVFIADNHNSFNLSIFTKNGQLLSALKGKSKHLQCLDIAIGRNGSLILTSKDNRIYIYSYAFY